MNTMFVFCNHAERANRHPAGKESEKYPGITKKGEEQAREKTKVLAKMICDLPGGSVVILGGCSKAIRTASTLAVFTDELRKTLGENDVLFSEPFNSASPLDSLKKIAEKASNDKSKVIVDFPLRIEEFISLPGQKETAVARRMVTGLNGQVGFFRRFFLGNMVLVNAVHAPETAAFINYLQKRSCSTLANIVNFM